MSKFQKSNHFFLLKRNKNKEKYIFIEHSYFYFVTFFKFLYNNSTSKFWFAMQNQQLIIITPFWKVLHFLIAKILTLRKLFVIYPSKWFFAFLFVHLPSKSILATVQPCECGMIFVQKFHSTSLLLIFFRFILILHKDIY